MAMGNAIANPMSPQAPVIAMGAPTQRAITIPLTPQKLAVLVIGTLLLAVLLVLGFRARGNGNTADDATSAASAASAAEALAEPSAGSPPAPVQVAPAPSAQPPITYATVLPATAAPAPSATTSAPSARTEPVAKTPKKVSRPAGRSAIPVRREQ